MLPCSDHSSSHTALLSTLLYQAAFWSGANADGYNLMTDCACMYNARRKQSLPLADDQMNYPFVRFAIFWSNSTTHVRKSYGEEPYSDHKYKRIGDIRSTWSPVICLWRWVRRTPLWLYLQNVTWTTQKTLQQNKSFSKKLSMDIKQNCLTIRINIITWI